MESGEWCESREPLIRDLVAGTADESARRQAQQHLDHCRACSDLAARLSGHLNEMGGMVALTSVAGLIGGKLTLLDRFGDLLHGGREAAAGIVERGGSEKSALWRLPGAPAAPERPVRGSPQRSPGWVVRARSSWPAWGPGSRQLHALPPASFPGLSEGPG